VKQKRRKNETYAPEKSSLATQVAAADIQQCWCSCHCSKVAHFAVALLQAFENAVERMLKTWVIDACSPRFSSLKRRDLSYMLAQ